MAIQTAELSQVLDYWSQQRHLYGSGPYALFLCGDGTQLEKQAFEFFLQNGAMLNDMTGPYLSVTLVAWRLDAQLNVDATSPELEYLHAAHSWTLGASGVYSLASALDLPLNRFPMIVLSVEPWTNNEVLILSLRDFADTSGSSDFDHFVYFFAKLSTACRFARKAPEKRMLRIIQSQMKDMHDDSSQPIIKKISESGFLAQIIEGLIKGFGLGGD